MAWNHKKQEIQALTEANEIVQQRAEDAESLIESARGIEADVIAELKDLREVGILEEEARILARIAIEGAERERLSKELSEKIKHDEYDRHAADVRINEGAKIVTQLHELFGADGTFDEIRERAEHDVRVEIQAEVMESERISATASIDTKENREKFKAEIAEEVQSSEELSDFREKKRRELEEGWRGEATESAKAEISEEEAERKDKFIAEYRETFKTSAEGDKARDSARKKYEKKWKDASVEQIATELEDQELLSILHTRAQQEKAILEREIISKKLTEVFEGPGLDSSKLEASQELIIYLGTTEVTTVKQEREDRWGNKEKYDVEKLALNCKRKLTLTARGEGKFVVDGDSLLDATSPYDRSFALHRGTVIVPGRKLSENGDGYLDPHLAADVPMYYDDDISTPETITDCLLPVANISVNGIHARQIDIVRMV